MEQTLQTQHLTRPGLVTVTPLPSPPRPPHPQTPLVIQRHPLLIHRVIKV